MFALPVWQISTHVRSGPSLWMSEGVATFGLVLTIFGCGARAPDAAPYAVGLYITAAYWFTASTSFANPAVTIARALSDTFAGIPPSSVAAFILAQLTGTIAPLALASVALASRRCGLALESATSRRASVEFSPLGETEREPSAR